MIGTISWMSLQCWRGWLRWVADLNAGSNQGGRNCAGARVAPAEKFGLYENFKPEHTLFCRELRFAAIYALFSRSFGKKVPFWVKNSVSVARSALLHGHESFSDVAES